MRLPIARQMLQTIVDATGGGKRPILSEAKDRVSSNATRAEARLPLQR